MGREQSPHPATSELPAWAQLSRHAEWLWDTQGTPGQSKTRGYLISMEFY